MKKISVFYLLLLLTSFSTLKAQQWVEKNYTYDSVLNLRYGAAPNFTGPADSLFMDLYLPQCDDPDPSIRRPLLLWIHGGAFLAGSKNDPGITRLCKQFAKRGYVTASVGYRLGFVSDDAAWTCNFPNYSCVFAADSAEWIRAWYRGVQDAKGALRYLVNRNNQYRIDVANIFVAGESAGSFIALGVGLLDTVVERLPQTYSLTAAPKPNNNTLSCDHNAGRSFTSSTVSRPDLGDIHGTVEPTVITYTIKGIGNVFGGMFSDLLRYSPAGKLKPAIYSFHQPCDMVVPVDSGRIYAGLSWCMTNGYNCAAIASTPRIYGSRGFSHLNSTGSYGYNIHNEITSTSFPYNYLFGPGSCLDQVNNPCHAYDNPTLRENNMAAFFAPLVSTPPLCLPAASGITGTESADHFRFYPNPSGTVLHLETGDATGCVAEIRDLTGQRLKTLSLDRSMTTISLQDLPPGMLTISVLYPDGRTKHSKFFRE